MNSNAPVGAIRINGVTAGMKPNGTIAANGPLARGPGTIVRTGAPGMLETLHRVVMYGLLKNAFGARSRSYLEILLAVFLILGLTFALLRLSRVSSRPR